MSSEHFTDMLRESHEAGGSTTAAHIMTLIMAFAKYPHIVKKAQAEIDQVCGADRAPTWSSDFRRLPYINCIVKEGLRWRPVAPTGLPHKVRQGELQKPNSTPFF